MRMRRYDMRRVCRTGVLLAGMCVCVYAAGYFSGELVIDAAEQKSVHITESIQVADKVSGIMDTEPTAHPQLLSFVLPPAQPPTVRRVEDTSPLYALTAEERDTVERVVMAEAGGEDYEGQRLVAQCILNGCLLEDMRPPELVIEYRYTSKRPEPSESVCAAVSAVFDDGDMVIDEPILYFYAPALCTSSWHESQRFVLEHGGHRFFAAR